MSMIFRKSRKLAAQIDEFLDSVSEGILIFSEGIQCYLTGDEERFARKIVQIDKKEANADKLRRDVENQLYAQSLIPEHRGDVLALLETMDHVIDSAKRTLTQFDVERPDIPLELHKPLMELATSSEKAGEMIVCATRAFFRDIREVKNYLHKVYHYEKEADRQSDQIKRQIFATDWLLSQKMHLRYFTLHIEIISDKAEEVADRLSIYTIKRTI
jgi:predicted phosphate transport protein (TIGR00153 family)